MLKIRNNLLSFLFLMLVSVAFAQQQQQSGNPSPQKKEEKKESKYNSPLLNGLMLGVDLYNPVANLFGQKYGNYEASLELNLYNRFFPIWEIGIGRANNRPEDMNFTYVGKPALFNRIGLNYNFQYNNDGPGYFYIGLRYGFSSFKYDVTNITLESPYWGTTYNESIVGQSSNAQWIEALGGIRVRLYKDLMMGWTVRYKWLLKNQTNEFSTPWFIPGYGNKGSVLGITYSIYYKFPLKKKKTTDSKTEKAPSK